MITQDDSGQTLLHLASQEGRVEVAQLLKRVAYANARDESKRPPLHRASQHRGSRIATMWGA